RFWEEARGSDAEPGTTQSALGAVARPEAGTPMMVSVGRADRPGSAAGIPVLGTGASSSSNGSAPRPDRSTGVPTGVSVTGRVRGGEEPVYVPSAISEPRAEPRQADLEEVAGRPVWVVYRPSAGLEVGADGAGNAGSGRAAD